MTDTTTTYAALSVHGLAVDVPFSHMLDLTAKLQEWRTYEDTLDLARIMAAEGKPFCCSCADWHHADQDHSMTTHTDADGRKYFA